MSPRPLALRYGIVPLSNGLAIALWLFRGHHLAPSPFLVFMAAVALTAWWGGLGPALAAIATSTCACLLLYYLPLDLRGFTATQVILQLLTFFVVSLLITALQVARQRAERALAEQALHDPLTGLPNRRLFADRLRQLLDSSQRAGRSFSLVLLDLDGFKAVNDSLGHLQGDVVLMELAHRLRAHVRVSDTVARLGGDEFALLLPETDGQSAGIVIGMLEQHLRQPFVLAGQERPIHVSMGLAVYPESGPSEEVLLQRADMAMYARKHGQGSRPASVAQAVRETHRERAAEVQAS